MHSATRSFTEQESVVTIELNQANKWLVWNFWQALERTGADRLEEAIASSVDASATWPGQRDQAYLASR